MIENHQVNLFNSKYNPTKGILQFTVFFDHPVAAQEWVRLDIHTSQDRLPVRQGAPAGAANLETSHILLFNRGVQGDQRRL